MPYLQIIQAAAKAAQVSAVLLYAICGHESRDFTLDFALYDNGSPSYGVCQIKEGTARMLGFKGSAMELRNPYIGIKYAALYLKYQQERYGDNNWCALAASYNSGTYTESKYVGYPRNLKYVRLVQRKLSQDYQSKLNCGEQLTGVK